MSANGKALAFVECGLDALLSLSQECQSNEWNSCSGGLVSDMVSDMVWSVMWSLVVWSVMWSAVVWSVMWSLVVWSGQ